MSISKSMILEVYEWYVDEPERSVPGAISGFGLNITASGLTYQFKKYGLKLKPRGSKPGVTRGDIVTLCCETCGNHFRILESVYRARTKRSEIRYCSRHCMSIGQRKSGTYSVVQCNQCGKVFDKRTDRLTPNNYCSVSCLGKSKMVEGALWRSPTYIKNYMQRYQQDNKERLARKGREYIKNNKHIKKKAQRNYRRRHKDYIAFLARGRSASVKVGSFSQTEWDGMKQECNYSCLCCGRKEPEIKLEMDHIKPLSIGGEHCMSNIQPLCRSCNASKGSKHIDYRTHLEYELRIVK